MLRIQSTYLETGLTPPCFGILQGPHHINVYPVLKMDKGHAVRCLRPRTSAYIAFTQAGTEKQATGTCIKKVSAFACMQIDILLFCSRRCGFRPGVLLF
jgi:hypothetical protein